jgi:phosphatidylserine decarboxylase
VAKARGDEFGVFEMGSTVVLVMEQPSFEAVGELGRRIRMGEVALRRTDR